MPLDYIDLQGFYLGRDGKMYAFVSGFCPEKIFMKMGSLWACFEEAVEKPDIIPGKYSCQIDCNCLIAYEFICFDEGPSNYDYVFRENAIILTPFLAYEKVLRKIQKTLFPEYSERS